MNLPKLLFDFRGGLSIITGAENMEYVESAIVYKAATTSCLFACNFARSLQLYEQTAECK
jgi:hypothetical protein